MARNWYDSVVPEDAAAPAREIDVTLAHPARVYDYWLGGKDNFAADRAAAEGAAPDPGRGRPWGIVAAFMAAPSSGYAVVARKP